MAGNGKWVKLIGQQALKLSEREMAILGVLEDARQTNGGWKSRIDDSTVLNAFELSRVINEVYSEDGCLYAKKHLRKNEIFNGDWLGGGNLSLAEEAAREFEEKLLNSWGNATGSSLPLLLSDAFIKVYGLDKCVRGGVDFMFDGRALTLEWLGSADYEAPGFREMQQDHKALEWLFKMNDGMFPGQVYVRKSFHLKDGQIMGATMFGGMVRGNEEVRLDAGWERHGMNFEQYQKTLLSKMIHNIRPGLGVKMPEKVYLEEARRQMGEILGEVAAQLVQAGIEIPKACDRGTGRQK